MRDSGATKSRQSAFKTSEGEAAFIAAYDDAIKLWPVSYEEREIPTRFGLTHVVVSGRQDAPPLVLLHGSIGTLLSWAPNIVDLSKHHCVYTIDVMGQRGTSVSQRDLVDARVCELLDETATEWQRGVSRRVLGAGPPGQATSGCASPLVGGCHQSPVRSFRR